MSKTLTKSRVHQTLMYPPSPLAQDERSQLQNRRGKAMRILRSRLLQAERQRQAAERAATRLAQVSQQLARTKQLVACTLSLSLLRIADWASRAVGASAHVQLHSKSHHRPQSQRVQVRHGCHDARGAARRPHRRSRVCRGGGRAAGRSCGGRLGGAAHWHKG